MAANLLEISKANYVGVYIPTNDVIDVIAKWTSINIVACFGKTGSTVADYALATLKWLDTPYSLEKYDELIKSIDTMRKTDIEQLINSNLYVDIPLD